MSTNYSDPFFFFIYSIGLVKIRPLRHIQIIAIVRITIELINGLMAAMHCGAMG